MVEINSSVNNAYQAQMGQSKPQVTEAKTESTPHEVDQAVERQKQVDREVKNAEKQAERNHAIGEDQMAKMIEKAMKLVAGKSTHLEFSIHEKTKQIMVKVRDNDTGEIIREIPPEKSFDFLAKVWEMTGVLVDERR